jgi:hypothetical protein
MIRIHASLPSPCATHIGERVPDLLNLVLGDVVKLVGGDAVPVKDDATGRSAAAGRRVGKKGKGG